MPVPDLRAAKNGTKIRSTSSVCAGAVVRDLECRAGQAVAHNQTVAAGRTEFRVSVVRNLDTWYDAFKPKPTEALFLAPDKHVKIW